MVMLKTEVSAPSWVPEGYKKLGWHAGFDGVIGPMYFYKEVSMHDNGIKNMWV